MHITRTWHLGVNIFIHLLLRASEERSKSDDLNPRHRLHLKHKFLSLTNHQSRTYYFILYYTSCYQLRLQYVHFFLLVPYQTSINSSTLKWRYYICEVNCDSFLSHNLECTKNITPKDIYIRLIKHGRMIFYSRAMRNFGF